MGPLRSTFAMDTDNMSKQFEIPAIVTALHTCEMVKQYVEKNPLGLVLSRSTYWRITGFLQFRQDVDAKAKAFAVPNTSDRACDALVRVLLNSHIFRKSNGLFIPFYDGKTMPLPQGIADALTRAGYAVQGKMLVQVAQKQTATKAKANNKVRKAVKQPTATDTPALPNGNGHNLPAVIAAK